MTVQVVRTPTDMRGAINDAARVNFILITEEMEPEVRRAWDGIYADFTYMSPLDEPGFIASYLESIEEPLRDLRALGMQIVYVTSRGTLSGVRMGMTDFTIAPSPCYFRVEGDPSAHVHMLGADCADGDRAFIAEEGDMRVWRSVEGVEQSFEHAGTPWCATCSMASVGQG
jgi:hypothetical protein